MFFLLLSWRGFNCHWYSYCTCWTWCSIWICAITESEMFCKSKYFDSAALLSTFLSTILVLHVFSGSCFSVAQSESVTNNNNELSTVQPNLTQSSTGERHYHFIIIIMITRLQHLSSFGLGAAHSNILHFLIFKFNFKLSFTFIK